MEGSRERRLLVSFCCSVYCADAKVEAGVRLSRQDKMNLITKLCN